jgi:hypothetical protein
MFVSELGGFVNVYIAPQHLTYAFLPVVPESRMPYEAGE